MGRSLVTASLWYDTFPAPALSAGIEGRAPVFVRRFTGIPPEIVQPALKDNIVCMHLGGPKRVHRWHGVWSSVHDVEVGGLTLMPALEENRWLTSGPIDFTHLTLGAGLLSQIAVEEFDYEPAACALGDRVGFRDPLIESVFRAIVQELEEGGPQGRLYVESLLLVLGLKLLRDHSADALKRRRSCPTGPARIIRKGGLAGWQIRRVVDHMAEHLGADIALTTLTGLTGLSRAQFFRAFKQSTGATPSQLLKRMRIDRARVLLDKTDISAPDIGRAVGFAKPAQFAAAFKRQVGLPLKLYRTAEPTGRGRPRQDDNEARESHGTP